MLVLRCLVGLHGTIQFQLLRITLWGIALDCHDIEWFALETNRDHSVVFETTTKYYISDSFIDCEGYSLSSKRFVLSSRYKKLSELNSPIPVHFSYLILKC